MVWGASHASWLAGDLRSSTKRSLRYLTIFCGFVSFGGFKRVNFLCFKRELSIVWKFVFDMTMCVVVIKKIFWLFSRVGKKIKKKRHFFCKKKYFFCTKKFFFKNRFFCSENAIFKWFLTYFSINCCPTGYIWLF